MNGAEPRALRNENDIGVFDLGEKWDESRSFETQGQAYICELEHHWFAFLSSKVLLGSVNEMEGANVFLLCPEMLSCSFVLFSIKVSLISSFMCLLPLSRPVILIVVVLLFPL